VLPTCFNSHVAAKNRLAGLARGLSPFWVYVCVRRERETERVKKVRAKRRGWGCWCFNFSFIFIMFAWTLIYGKQCWLWICLFATFKCQCTAKARLNLLPPHTHAHIYICIYLPTPWPPTKWQRSCITKVTWLTFYFMYVRLYVAAKWSGPKTRSSYTHANIHRAKTKSRKPIHKVDKNKNNRYIQQQQQIQMDLLFIGRE